jgi:hypothetical protein
MLNKSTLKQEILVIMNNKPTSLYSAAQLWSDAYDIYAKDATDLSGDTIKSGTNKDSLLTKLHEAFLSMDAGISSTKINEGVISYWGSVVFNTDNIIPPWTSKISSKVTYPPLLNPESLYTIFMSLENSATYESKAIEISDYLHTITTTAKATISYMEGQIAGTVTFNLS